MIHKLLKDGNHMTKPEREQKEYASLFTDERYAKRAWKQFISKSLQSDAVALPNFIDAHGNVTPQSEIYDAAYRSVKRRLRDEGLDREPMKAEVLIEASVIRAAFDTNTLNLILDRTAGKVKEEISIGTGQYEELSDEELQLLAAHRTKQLAKPEEDNNA
jgi:hypothetical protein